MNSRHKSRMSLTSIAAALLAALLAGVCTTAAGLPGLLPADADWGSPPAEDWPQRAPKILPLKGWCRYLGTQKFSRNSSLDAQRVYSSDDGLLSAHDAASGRLVWQSRLSNAEYGAISLSPGDPLLAHSDMAGVGVQALDPADGKALWNRSEMKFIGRAGDQAWLGFPMNADDWRNPWQTASFELVDLQSGTANFTVTLPGIKARALGDVGPAGPLALALSDACYLIYGDGRRVKVAVEDPDWSCVLKQFPGGLLIAQSAPDPDELLALQSGRSNEEIMNDTDYEAREARWAEWKPLPSRLSCYSVPDGRLLWRSEYSSADPEAGNYLFLDEQQIEVSGNYVRWNTDNGSQILRLSDGQPAVDLSVEAGMSSLALSPERLYEMSSLTDEGAELRVHDLLSGEVRSTTLPLSSYVEDLAVSNGFLLLSPGTGGWNDAFPENAQLYCLELGADGLPQGGEMLALDFPSEFPELQKLFFASAAPIQDQELMRSIITSGMNAVFRLTEQCGLDDAVHLDALAAATEYLMRRQGSDRYNTSAVNGFMQLLRERAGSELVPHLSRWLKDSTLAALQPQLPGLLADCGTSEAASQLAGATPPTGIPHEASAPPYTVKPSSSYPTGFGPGSSETAPSILAAADGSSWAAFFCDGLLSGTVIYLAHDLQSDGSYEQVWPTALRQCYDQQPRGDYEHPQALGGLRLLSAADGRIELSYQRAGWDASLAPDKHGWGADFVEPVNTALTLAELELDSDDDGLSDVTEKLLETDPLLADSDGDGVLDALDGAPLSNPAWMGPDERGVARALAFFFADIENGRGNQWWDNGTGNPWRARYLTLYGAAPVDYVQRADTYSIFERPEQQRDWSAGPNMNPDEYAVGGDEHVELTWNQGRQSVRERYAQYCQKLGLDPAVASAAQILAWSSRFGSYYSGEGEDPAAQEAAMQKMLDEVQAPSPMDGLVSTSGSASLSIDFHGVGFVVELKLIDGEYYPLRTAMTWIS